MTDKPRFLVTRYDIGESGPDWVHYGPDPCSLEDAVARVAELGPVVERLDAITLAGEPSDPDDDGRRVIPCLDILTADRRFVPDRTLARLLRLARVETGIIV